MLSKLHCAPVVCLMLIAGTLLAKEKPQEIFNGKDLQGWEGDTTLWSVEDGAIVGRTTAEAPIKNNTFLIWKDGKVGDDTGVVEFRAHWVAGEGVALQQGEVHERSTFRRRAGRWFYVGPEEPDGEVPRS